MPWKEKLRVKGLGKGAWYQVYSTTDFRSVSLELEGQPLQVLQNVSFCLVPFIILDLLVAWMFSQLSSVGAVVL